MANNYQGGSWQPSSQAHVTQADAEELEAEEEQFEENTEDIEVEEYAAELPGIPTTSNWYLDSGASTHVTGNKKLLTDLRRGPHTQITTANGRALLVNAPGAIIFTWE